MTRCLLSYLIVPTWPHPAPWDSHPVTIRHCPHSLFSRHPSGTRPLVTTGHNHPLNSPALPVPGNNTRVPNRRLSVFLCPLVCTGCPPPPCVNTWYAATNSLSLSLVVPFVVVKFLELSRPSLGATHYSYKIDNLTSNLCESCILTSSSFWRSDSDNNFLDLVSSSANFNLKSFVRVWVIVKTRIIDSSPRRWTLKITVKAKSSRWVSRKVFFLCIQDIVKPKCESQV